MSPVEDTRARLNQNLDDLIANAKSTSPESSSSPDPAASRNLCKLLAEEIPLSHATGQEAFLSVLEHGALFSWPQLIKRRLARPSPGVESSVETTLGTEDSVFTYAAPFRYPETSCGLLFKTELERHRTDQSWATPFDSGATLRFLRPDDSEEEQIAFVRCHELPVPDYRQALEKLLENCFASPWDYVEGTDPLRWPVPVNDGDWRRWTFEVRFQDQIRLTRALLAAFLPRAVASEIRVLQQIAAWRRSGIEVKLYEAPRGAEWQTLQSMSVDYLRSSLPKVESWLA